MKPLLQYFSEPSWRAALGSAFEQPYFQALEVSLTAREASGAHVFPAKENIFAAFNLTPLDKVKTVILGQDPYHGPGQAMGLSFSVPADVRVPPSLRNIFREIESDTGRPASGHGDLTHWAKQGVLLLNSVLTVEEKKAGAHAKLGWQRFTDQAIAAVSQRQEGVIFMLWGAYAQQKKALVDEDRHKVLIAPHPSPLSAYKGFLGCQHFSQANAYLKEAGKEEIFW